jgi:7-cyano-7-deazaguanine synthase
MTSVLLYSGGLDSYITAALVEPDILLHVEIGTFYGLYETSRLVTPPTFAGQLVRVELNLSPWERGDLIIPGRNAHLALLAAGYGDDILFGATAGDRVSDKDDEFAIRMTHLLRHLYKPQWWIADGRKPTVSLPVKAFTKAQLVDAFLDGGGDPRRLVSDTFSCYTPTANGSHCGRCKPCARKWVALRANDIDPDFDASDLVAETYYTAILDGTWDRGNQEALEVLRALEVVGA